MKKVKIIGHRGAAGYAPENTLLSFEKAIEAGCDVVELDVRLSKDNEAVIIHDPKVDRVSDGQGLVSEMNLAEIKKLNCGKGQKIPTLQEVIDVCKDRVDLQIELKAKGTPNLVYNIVIKNNILSKVLITSFNIKLLQKIRSLDSDIKIGFLFKKYTKRFAEELKQLKKSISIDYAYPKSSIINKEMVDKVHNLGMKIYAYDVNKKELGERLINLGVDGMGTDFPDLFIREVVDDCRQ